MRLQLVQRYHFQRAFMGGLQHHRRRHTSQESLLPTRHADAPSVTGLQAGKAIFRPWRGEIVAGALAKSEEFGVEPDAYGMGTAVLRAGMAITDRKSTRLNSSHTVISYAVFCLRSEEHTSEL